MRVMEDVLIPAPPEVPTYAPTAAVFHNQVHVGGDVVLVRRDGTAVAVMDYWYETPGAVSFVIKGHRFGSIPVSDLDLKETVRINQERRIAFKGAK